MADQVLQDKHMSTFKMYLTMHQYKISIYSLMYVVGMYVCRYIHVYICNIYNHPCQDSSLHIPLMHILHMDQYTHTTYHFWSKWHDKVVLDICKLWYPVYITYHCGTSFVYYTIISETSTKSFVNYWSSDSFFQCIFFGEKFDVLMKMSLKLALSVQLA